MNPDLSPTIDAELVCRLAALNGLSLSAEAAAAHVPALAALQTFDARLAALDLSRLPVAGLPWEPFEHGNGRTLQRSHASAPASKAADDFPFVASIAEVAAGYRDGSLSPVAFVTEMLARIEARNPTLNAFLTVTADAALAAAAAAETELACGVDRGLLHGVPVALKDLVDTAGVRTTCGSRILAEHVPVRDAAIVEHLRRAGAVIVGKTNMLEFAYGIVHPDVGPAWNPTDPIRTAGGSSGGSAAAVAAGLCCAAVGTDTGGSIRIPAAYCGVAGLKPTYGLVSVDGIFPLSPTLDHVGPIARSSADAALLFDALVGQPPQPLVPAELRGLRLGLIEAHRQGDEMQPAVQAVFDAACADLAAAGARILPVEIPHLSLADGVLFPVIGPEASLIHARWMHERPQDYAAVTRQQLELGFIVPSVTYLRCQQFRRVLTGEFLAALAEVDLLLSPTAPWVAPFEDPHGEEGSHEARRTGPYNLTGLPALTVNCGFGPGGLPIGLQLAGRPGADRELLAVGAAVERVLER